MTNPEVARHRAELRRAVEAVEIVSARRFTWLGVGVDVVGARRAALRTAAVRTLLLRRLTDLLYRCFYTQGGVARPDRPDAGGDRSAHVRATMAALADQWTGPPFRPSAGFLALDRGAGRTTAQREVSRIYVNAHPRGVVALAAAIATTLEDAGIPFELKLLADPAHLDRCDPLVSYVRAADLPGALPLVAAAVSAGRNVRSPVPAFTRRVGRGIGIATDPVGGSSFGRHRCGLVATGLARAYDLGAVEPEARLKIVAAEFAARGLSVDAPYRSPSGGNALASSAGIGL